MALTINHETNDISATGSDSVTIDGAAVGGGGGGGDPDLYRDNASSATTPVASGTNAVAVGHNSVASANRAMAFGASTDATAGWSCALGNGAQAGGENSVAIGSSRATGSEAVAIGIGGSSGNGATGSASIAMGNSASASGQNSVAIGKGSVSTGTRSLAVGTSRAAGNYSVAMMIGSNSTSYGTFGGSRNLAMGELAKAHYGSYALGSQASATGQKSYALGTRSTASGEKSFALGFDAVSTPYGKYAYASGMFGASGDAQGGQYILRADVTDTTVTTLTTNNSTASTTNQIVAASDTAIAFDGIVTALQNGAQGTSAWKIQGVLVNDGGANTYLFGSSVTAISNGSGFTLALSADNTNKALSIKFTGYSNYQIRVVANVRTSEVTHA